MEQIKTGTHNKADNRFIWGYYLLIALLILFLIYHAVSVEIVASAEFSSDVSPFVCPIVQLH